MNEKLTINGKNLEIDKIIPSSGLIIKRDPGVPIVYLSFFLLMIGGLLSILNTNQIWVIKKDDTNEIYIGGISNRNLTGLARELPNLI